MKPTLIRNRTIYKASSFIRSKQMCSHLSDDLAKKYNKRSVRVTEGDTVKVMRGEYKGVSGKILRVSSEKNGVAIEGIKKEKLKGGNLDVYIHTSNLVVTDLNTEDKWRVNKLEGKAQPKESKTLEKKESKPEQKPKTEQKADSKPAQKEAKKDKESKVAKTAKKEDK